MSNKKKNLDSTLTLRDFQEYVDFSANTFTTKDDLKELKDEIILMKDEI